MINMNVDTNMLTIDDVAKQLNVSRQTVTQLIMTSNLRAYKIQSVYRIKQDDIDQYLKFKEVGGMTK